MNDFWMGMVVGFSGGIAFCQVVLALMPRR